MPPGNAAAPALRASSTPAHHGRACAVSFVPRPRRHAAGPESAPRGAHPWIGSWFNVPSAAYSGLHGTVSSHTPTIGSNALHTGSMSTKDAGIPSQFHLNHARLRNADACGAALAPLRAGATGRNTKCSVHHAPAGEHTCRVKGCAQRTLSFPTACWSQAPTTAGVVRPKECARTPDDEHHAWQHMALQRAVPHRLRDCRHGSSCHWASMCVHACHLRVRRLRVQ